MDYQWMWNQLRKILVGDELYLHNKYSNHALFLMHELEKDSMWRTKFHKQQTNNNDSGDRNGEAK
jgi:hypothetical protein